LKKKECNEATPTNAPLSWVQMKIQKNAVMALGHGFFSDFH
jgi:hypothetical protein